MLKKEKEEEKKRLVYGLGVGDDETVGGPVAGPVGLGDAEGLVGPGEGEADGDGIGV